jgi:predicted RNA-binding protein with PIN domain
MPTHIIIDGYNLIRQSPSLAALDRRDLARGREALLSRLAAYRRLKAHRITVVFDGAQAPELSPARDRLQGITIIYSRAGETADTLIVRMTRLEGERAMVVSSDQALARQAEANGAAVIGSREFESRMALAAAMEGAAAPEETGSARRVSTKKRGEGYRLSKRLRKLRQKTAKL